MQIIEIQQGGTPIQREINRRTLTTEFDLHLRDLRPVFSLRQVTTILRRGAAIILNFKAVKMIIAEDRALIFNLENPKIVDQFIPLLSQNLKRHEAEETPFELLVLDSALAYIIQKTKANFDRLQSTSQTVLRALERDPRDEDLSQLLQLKKRMSQLENRAQEAEDMLIEIINDDEEIERLCLGVSTQEKAEEAESVLENSLEQIENISHQIDELNENIDDTQEIITLKLANLRNDIIRFDLVISVMTAIFGVLAVIVGLFGTNIKNSLEESHLAFWVLTALLIAIFVLGWLALYRYMKQKRLL